MERELVQRLGDRDQRLEAMRGLVGGVTATELRGATLSDAARVALCDGLRDPNPRVRWWCVQILDHVPDERALEALAGALDDPVPRVRRNAAHALGCVACKPTWDGELAESVLQRLAHVAEHDPNTKVQAQARLALACLVP